MLMESIKNIIHQGAFLFEVCTPTLLILDQFFIYLKILLYLSVAPTRISNRFQN